MKNYIWFLLAQQQQLEQQENKKQSNAHMTRYENQLKSQWNETKRSETIRFEKWKMKNGKNRMKIVKNRRSLLAVGQFGIEAGNN